MEKDEVRRAYDRLAPWFDVAEGVPDVLLGVRSLRRHVLRHASGRVLEVAAGTGRNLPHYPPGCSVTAVDLSGGMLDRLRARRAAREQAVPVARMDTERLGFGDGAFDTVVDSMALCTYPDPVAALGEMSRVCRPEGRILLVEHGRSSRDALARFQDRHEGWLADLVGCHWNRDPARLAADAGLTLREVRRTVLGIFHGIVADPAA